MSLPFRPHPDVTVVINHDVYDVRATADRAILDVLLARPRRQVDGHDDLLAAGVADVAGLVLHFLPVPPGRSPFLSRAHPHVLLAAYGTNSIWPGSLTS